MKRILYIIPTLDQSGAEKQLTLLASQLDRTRYAPMVLALTRGGHYEKILREQNTPVTILNKRWKLDPTTLWKLRSFIQSAQPDLIHSWLFAGNAYTRLVARSTAERPIVVSERCVDVWKSGWQFWIDKRLRNRTAHLLGNSQAVVDFYRELGYADEKTSVIPNGIEPFKGSSIVRQELLQKWNLPEDARLVGYVGRLAKQKRIKELLWSIQLLRQLDPRNHLILVGDGPERAAMEEYAEKVECKNFVRFVGHQKEARQWYPHFELFWLASDFEGQSNSIMEAMAAGIPVIASDIPANRELVTHDQTGYLIKLDDSVGRSQFSQKILDDDALKEKMGAAAQKQIDTQFSIAQMVTKHQDLYDRLTNPLPR